MNSTAERARETDARIGALLGERYQLLRLLGSGGMGAVYEAIDTGSRQRVAVKVLHETTDDDGTLIGRFAREACATAMLDSPHIVRVLDADEDGPSGRPFMVMEYIEGEDVHHLLKRLGRISPDLALRIVAQACLGLIEAHQARIIHRDIKPANLFLAEGPGGARIVKLLDFGIAKILRDPAGAGESTHALTQTGTMLGSPLYMAPEQARGWKTVDHRADLWSLGVVLYRALTGRTPHADSGALGELIVAICTETPASLHELAPWVPESVAAICVRAMTTEASGRYATAADMLAAIRPLLPGGWDIDVSMLVPLDEAAHVQPAPRSTPGSTTGPGTTARDLGFSTTAQAPGRRMRRSLASALMAGAVLAVAAGGIVLLGFGARHLAGPPRPAAPAQPSPGASAAAVAPPAGVRPPVRLLVDPRVTAVEIDGEPAVVDGDSVPIPGSVGSRHQVTLARGSAELTWTVLLTADGPVPGAILLDLDLPAPPARPVQPPRRSPQPPAARVPRLRPGR
jgi:serine/threonine-protein kinase